MADDLMAAVATLQRKLDEQLQAANTTKKTINMLLEAMGRPAQYPDISDSSGIIRADQFYGKPLATAASEYLELRKQACQPDDILRGLAEGGFDFDVMGWKESDRLRSLAISLAKNNAKFHRLKNGSFGLRGWYDEDFLKKAAPKQQRGGAVTESEPEESSADYRIDPDGLVVVLLSERSTHRASPPGRIKVGSRIAFRTQHDTKQFVQAAESEGFTFEGKEYLAG